MRANIVRILVTLAILEVSFARVFDEKGEAIKEIDVKVSEIISLQKNILKAADNEKKQITNVGEEELKKYLNLKTNETRVQFEKDTDAVIRTAIAKGRPVSVIYCIRNVFSLGNNAIIEASFSITKKVLEIRIKKVEKIVFDEYVIAAITKGLKELIEQAKTKIKDGEGVVQTIKKEAFSHCESAALLMGEIEVCLHEPILTREYVKMRQEIDRKLKDIKIKYNEEFENCLKQDKSKFTKFNSQHETEY